MKAEEEWSDQNDQRASSAGHHNSHCHPKSLQL